METIDTEELNYFTNMDVREEELRKLNADLDQKINDTNMDEDPISNAVWNTQKRKEGCNVDEDDFLNFSEFLSFDGEDSMDTLVEDGQKHSTAKCHSVRNKRPIANRKEHIGNSVSKSDRSKQRSSDIPSPQEEEGQEEDNLMMYLDDITNHTELQNKHASSHKPTNPTCKNRDTSTEMHLQKSQIKALTKQLKIAIQSTSQLSKSNTELKTKLSKMTESNRKLTSQVTKLQSLTSKKSNESKQCQNRMDDLSIENESLKKEVSSLRSLMKEFEAKSQTNELKLKRSLDSVERLKSKMMDYKSNREEENSLYCAQKQDYELKINELTKHRDHLIMGYKKQMQLINVLKQQKVHLEASRLLDFTEQEFVKAIDWGPVSNGKKGKR